jgi:putative pyruvate formate lyase activating enzyme
MLSFFKDLMMDEGFEPAYLKLVRSGEMQDCVASAFQHIAKCDLCAWECRVDRQAGVLGVCRSGVKARLSSYGPHLGEEDALRGWRGSGTIFFARCNMRCQFCQNYDISQTDTGEELEPEELAAIMLELQNLGCHNINLVSPSHVVPQILAAVILAAQNGLRLPIVFNTGGYDSLSALHLLDGVIDIYMPDIKYSSQHIARAYSRIPHYPQSNQAAVKEMHRQVGDLQIDAQGLAKRGLLVRHLVLPNGLAGTAEIARFLAEEISADTYLNLMDQYRPAYNVSQYPNRFFKLRRPVNRQEYQAALEMVRAAGLHRLDERRARP